MCNLYRMTQSAAEVARLFAAEAVPGANTGGEVYPGTPGLVIAGGAVRSMGWGFPLVLTGESGRKLKPRPVNNARTDKLDSWMWRASFHERRCLIPVSAFAEAEGPKGGKTRTWFSTPGAEPFACAGIWRDSEEWGPVFSMVMTDANAQVAPVHDRMPVILSPEDRPRWTGGAIEDARALCVPYAGQLQVERTEQPWNRR